MLVSYTLLPAVTHSGILPYDSLFTSDHRACYLDLNSSLVFHDITPSIAQALRRGLQLQDPRFVDQYYEYLWKQLEYHCIPAKIDRLEADVGKVHHSQISLSYNSIDKLVMEAMLYAESKCARKFTTTYNWSPALKQAVQAVRYWRLRIKRANGTIISSHTLATLQAEASLEPKGGLLMPDLVKCIRDARAHLRDLQAKHVELRENHLQSLAEARVLSK